MSKQFVITSILTELPSTLRLQFADGESFTLNLMPIIRAHKSLKRLEEPSVFASASIADDGRTVAWGDDDDLELASDNLRARAIEQAGEFSHEFIWNWMATHHFTLDEAARAIGVSRRMLAYYRSGQKPVPRTVGLACIGWETGKKIAA
ncbi:MAG: DUF2442 domain-containing protein [Betaproteobacteria bacterium]|nr:DUF2442 domain-containing protein [Betaproteobacteria bacterium]